MCEKHMGNRRGKHGKHEWDIRTIKLSPTYRRAESEHELAVGSRGAQIAHPANRETADVQKSPMSPPR